MGQLRQLPVTALGKDLDGLIVRMGLQHPLHALTGEQLVLHGPDAGGYGQVVGIFDLSQDIASIRPECASISEEDLGDRAVQRAPLETHQGLKAAIDLHIPVAEDHPALDGAGLLGQGEPAARSGARWPR